MNASSLFITHVEYKGAHSSLTRLFGYNELRTAADEWVFVIFRILCVCCFSCAYWCRDLLAAKLSHLLRQVCIVFIQYEI
jgi:hypothetical protein